MALSDRIIVMSRSMIAALPLMQASESGVTP